MNCWNYLVAGLLTAQLLAAASTEQISPWGLCAHLNRKEAEFDYRIDEQLRLLKEAGVKSVRMDLGFAGVARNKGSYDFTHYDEVLTRLETNGITLMPILSGYAWEVESTRPDAVPLHEHPEEWRGFVRAAAQHFKGRITVWSFWNEPDGGFWKPAPNPQQYLELLKITHDELKKADPDNQVLLGGIGVNFLRDVYQLGGKPYFDLISTHPYGWGGDRREEFNQIIDDLRKTLRENGDADKPVWFTECGASSCQNEFLVAQPQAIQQALQLAAHAIGRTLDPTEPLRVAVPCLPHQVPAKLSAPRPWLPGAAFVPVPAEKLDSLSIEEFPVLLGCESETTYEPLVEPLRNYVRRGGILLALGQIPFYGMTYRNELGSWAHKDAADELHQKFRMGFHTWWLRPGTPDQTVHVEPGPGMVDSGFIASRGHANRYLNGDKVRPEDHYQPLLQATDGSGKVFGDVLSLYTYSDWKGAIVASTLVKFSDANHTDQEQADLLQTVAVYSLSKQIPRFYFYNFRNTGYMLGEREDNFGIVTRDLQPKKAYYAYQSVTRALGLYPEFLDELPAPDGFKLMRFRRSEDGKTILAFWAINAGRGYRVSNVDGEFRDGSVHFAEAAGDPVLYQIQPMD